MAGLLRTAGYDVPALSTGGTGSLKIRATPKLALVLCDVNMPHMSGIELLSALQKVPRKRPRDARA